ncbi:TetR family transcriptional regulator [Salana multivorans]|uniref:TetR family transcriptional regulator n=2 Tax=Salana multivorans TaxID=120377 RepID=A0A3N2D7Q6_9MICO|nr:TetR family transcriptional regulator [Salana multivorans]
MRGMDPRIARTRRSLRDALFSLARERALDEISISDIADRAGINRSTYYQHYSDKDTLLAEALDAVIEDTVAEATESPITEADGARLLAAYLDHVEQNAALYRKLLGESGSAAIQVRMTRRLQSIIAAALDQAEGDARGAGGACGPGAAAGVPGIAGLPTGIVAAAMAGSALATVRAWLDLEPLPPTRTALDWIWAVLTAYDGGERTDRSAR